LLKAQYCTLFCALCNVRVLAYGEFRFMGETQPSCTSTAITERFNFPMPRRPGTVLVGKSHLLVPSWSLRDLLVPFRDAQSREWYSLESFLVRSSESTGAHTEPVEPQSKNCTALSYWSNRCAMSMCEEPPLSTGNWGTPVMLQNICER
jgi:hypothetical protein